VRPGGAEAHRTLMGNEVSQRQLERVEHVPDTLLSDHVSVWSFLPNESLAHAISNDQPRWRTKHLSTSLPVVASANGRNWFGFVGGK